MPDYSITFLTDIALPIIICVLTLFGVYFIRKKLLPGQVEAQAIDDSSTKNQNDESAQQNSSGAESSASPCQPEFISAQTSTNKNEQTLLHDKKDETDHDQSSPNNSVFNNPASETSSRIATMKMKSALQLKTNNKLQFTKSTPTNVSDNSLNKNDNTVKAPKQLNNRFGGRNNPRFMDRPPLKPDAAKIMKIRADYSNGNKLNSQNYKALGEIVKQSTGSHLSPLQRIFEVDKTLQIEFDEKKQTEEYQRMLNFRRELPSFSLKDKILTAIYENQRIIISGETGCGKTTQVGQYILDDAIEKGCGSTVRILCTQPRRLSTIAIAERVAAERAEKLGKSIGYSIRFEKVLCRDRGSIIFCTGGILFQYLRHSNNLRNFSHIILDEIHERNVECDVSMALLKQVMLKRPDLKIILMSATLNAKRFSEYYENCPIIDIPGFTHSVTEYYIEDILTLTGFRMKSPRTVIRSLDERKFFNNILEPELIKMEKNNTHPPDVIKDLRNPLCEELNLELIQSLLEYICTKKNPGAILIFLPGLKEIRTLTKNLIQSGKFPPHQYRICPLHSVLDARLQKYIFRRPPAPVRKIIISSSIAEASITIEDVVYVIDSGKSRISRFDPRRNLETLETEWQALANCIQRRGRAGRIQAGECFHLFTKARLNILDEHPTPEMQRKSLQDMVLELKMFQVSDIKDFFKNVLDPPDEQLIDHATEYLKNTDCLDVMGNVTPLGYHLIQLPLDLKTGKMVLLASIFSCVEPILSIAAGLSFKDPYVYPMDKEIDSLESKLELGLGEFSDHISLSEAVRKYDNLLVTNEWEKFCTANSLSWVTLQSLANVKLQLADQLYEMKFLTCKDPSDARANKNSNNLALIKAIVCAGLFPNIASIQYQYSRKTGKYPVYEMADGERVKIHPKSVIATVKELPLPYVAYYIKQKSQAIYLHDVTCVTQASILFAAPKYARRTEDSALQQKYYSFFKFYDIEKENLDLIQKMNKILMQKLKYPNLTNWESDEGQIFQAVIRYITEAEDEI